MSFWERLKDILMPPLNQAEGGKTPPAPTGNRPNRPEARRPAAPNNPQTERAARFQRLKFGEDYEAALALLEELEREAQAQNNQAQLADVALNRADIYSAQARYDEAKRLLDELHVSAEAHKRRALAAYVLCALGALAQAQDDWATAESHFQNAVDVAKAANAQGALGRAMAHLGDCALHEKNATLAQQQLTAGIGHLESSGDTELLPYFMGRLGDALALAGQTNEAEAQWIRAQHVAYHLRNGRAMRRLSVTLGQHATRKGDFEKALKYFKNAQEIAFSADGKPRRTEPHILLDYARMLCDDALARLQLNQTAEAIAQADRAEQLQTQAGQTDPALLATIASVRGLVARQQGQNEAAIDALQTAAAHFAAQAPTRLYIDVLLNLAAVQAQSDANASLATYQQALKVAEQLRLPLWRARAWDEIGLLERRRYAYPEALKAWTEAIRLYEGEGKHARVAQVNCQSAEVQFIMGNTRAQRDYEQALLRLNSIADASVRGQIIAQVARFYRDFGDLDTAEAFFSESIQIARDTHDALAEAERRGAYGFFLALTNRIDAGIGELRHSADQLKGLGHVALLALQQSRLGVAHDWLARLDDAESLHQAALNLAEPMEGSSLKAYVRLHYAEHLLRLSPAQVAAAEAHFSAILVQARAQQAAELTLRALLGLVRCGIRQKQLEPITAWLDEAKRIAQKAQIRRWTAETRTVQSEVMAALGKPKQAQADWDEAAKLWGYLRAPVPPTPWLMDNLPPQDV